MKTQIKILPKIFVSHFPHWGKQVVKSCHKQNSVEFPRHMKRVHTVYPATGLKSTHTNATRRERVRADQTQPTNHPFAPPSTNCGGREKGKEGKTKFSQKNLPYKWIVSKNQIKYIYKRIRNHSAALTSLTWHEHELLTWSAVFLS